VNNLPTCPECGYKVARNIRRCPNCGKEITSSIQQKGSREQNIQTSQQSRPSRTQQQQSFQTRPPRSQQAYHKTKKPVVAGILMIIGFISVLVSSLGALVGDPPLPPGAPAAAEEIYVICILTTLIFGFTLLVGAICAIKRTHWTSAIVASIIGVFSIGFIFTSSLLSLISVVLIAISKDEFGKIPERNTLESPHYQEEKYPSSPRTKEKPHPIQEGAHQNLCPDCGGKLRYINEYDRWYCDRCQEYK